MPKTQEKKEINRAEILPSSRDGDGKSEQEKPKDERIKRKENIYGKNRGENTQTATIFCGFPAISSDDRDGGKI